MVSSPGGGDTKGPVCPSLAHALHSHTLSSPGEEGAWKERGLPLGSEPGLPLSAPLPASAGAARCSVSAQSLLSSRDLGSPGRGEGWPRWGAGRGVQRSEDRALCRRSEWQEKQLQQRCEGRGGQPLELTQLRGGPASLPQVCPERLSSLRLSWWRWKWAAQPF